MTGINFIILKINGLDVSEMPQEEAVNIFLRASEPILVEVRRQKSDPSTGNFIEEDGIKNAKKFSNNFSYSMPCSPLKLQQSNITTPTHKNLEQNEHYKFFSLPTSPINSKNYDAVLNSKNFTIEMCSNDINFKENLNLKETFDKRKKFTSTAAQTEPLTIFNGTSILGNEIIRNEQGLFDECITPEIDFEEVVLKKLKSTDRIGLTVSYNCNVFDDKEPFTEVYISEVLPDSIAAKDGRLRQGDQILQVNGHDVLNKEETEYLISESKHTVSLLVSRCLFNDEYTKKRDCLCDEEKHHIVYENCTKEANCSPKISLEKPAIVEAKKLKNEEILNSHENKNILMRVLSPTDPLNHINIRAHIDSVTQEVAFLDSRMENIMMHTCSPSGINEADKNKTLKSFINSESVSSHMYRVPFDSMDGNGKKQSIDSEQEMRNYVKFPNSSKMKLVESDTEHIYETISEDTETEPVYCSPYENSDHNLVEKWLDMQESSTINHQKNKLKKQLMQLRPLNKQYAYHNHDNNSTNPSNNSSCDDHENSSSAYNTGGSCNSANQLTLELNLADVSLNETLKGSEIRPTLVFCSPTLENYGQNMPNDCYDCNPFPKEIRKDKTLCNSGSPKFRNPSNFIISQQKKFFAKDQYLTKTSDPRACDKTLRSTYLSNPPDMNVNFSNDVKLQEVIQKNPFRQVIPQQNPINPNEKIAQMKMPVGKNLQNFFTAPNLSKYHFVSSQEVRSVTIKPSSNDDKMEWKVKRRQDGTRYIVRRPVRNRILRDRATKEDKNEPTTEEDTNGKSTVKTERKKHFEKIKERRNRQHNLVINKNVENSIVLQKQIFEKTQSELPMSPTSGLGNNQIDCKIVEQKKLIKKIKNNQKNVTDSKFLNNSNESSATRKQPITGIISTTTV